MPEELVAVEPRPDLELPRGGPAASGLQLGAVKSRPARAPPRRGPLLGRAANNGGRRSSCAAGLVFLLWRRGSSRRSSSSLDLARRRPYVWRPWRSGRWRTSRPAASSRPATAAETSSSPGARLLCSLHLPLPPSAKLSRWRSKGAQRTWTAAGGRGGPRPSPPVLRHPQPRRLPLPARWLSRPPSRTAAVGGSRGKDAVPRHVGASRRPWKTPG
ncbi:unnamed protein product [Urochloa humidicola]